MDFEELIEVIRARRGMVLPFVGSGLAIAAGAPSAADLAEQLAVRAGLAAAGRRLADVTEEAEARFGVVAVQEILAAIVTGWRLQPTPALIAVCGSPSRRVLTTNYDDGIERAAASLGIEAIPMLATDRAMLTDPDEGQVHVIHLHGLPGRPESLVLPGRTTDALGSNTVFETFMRATMAGRHVVHLGFSFSASEPHLHAIMGWLHANVPDALGHYLALPEDEIATRAAEIATIEAYGLVTIVGYVRDPSHTAVESVALAFAPRSGDLTAGQHDAVTWVQPVLARVAADEGWERLRQRAVSFDHGITVEEFFEPRDLLGQGRALVLAGPGMGKSRLLSWLPSMAGDRPCAIASLAGFRSAPAGDPPERAVSRMLTAFGTDERLPAEVLRDEQAVLLLDGLEEADEDLLDEAVAAILAAVERWPRHCWIVASRPGAAADALAENGFTTFAILASRRWGRRYLKARGIPAHRVSRAMLDGYGLGDLISVPLFAARLADRLLRDDLAELSSLALLVDEQNTAVVREAAKRGYPAADLAAWLRSLAIALELRGRTSATSTEVAQIPGPGDLDGVEARRRLVDASLLVDAPDVAAFPQKPLQEGLTAQAILDARDAVSLLREAAVAKVAGVERLRDDADFMIDLVFEHADPLVRDALRKIDEQRWARTVLTRGGVNEAREALALLLEWHAARNMPFGWLGEAGLRTSLAAVAAVARRWPELVEEHRDELENASRTGSESECARALTLLGELPEDARTRGWLLPRLADARPRIVAQAATIAGRLRIQESADRLLELVNNPQDLVRRSVLVALIDLLPPARLPELAAAVRYEGLRPVAEQLLDRPAFHLDTGIEFVSQISQMDATTAWIVERLVATAHPDAWTADRVAALMRACRHTGGAATPNPRALAAVFARHPAAAIAAVHVPHGGPAGPWGPESQLLPLSLLDPALLADDDHEDLRIAIERQVAERDRSVANQERPQRELARLAELLDQRGTNIPVDALETHAQLRTLEPRHRAALEVLLDAWWPATFDLDADGWLPARTRVVLAIGTQMKPALTTERWQQLLDAHIAARAPHVFELAGGAVTSWLMRSRPDDLETLLLPRFAAAANGDELSRLIAVAGIRSRSERLTAAAFARLAEIDAGSPLWANAAGLLLSPTTLASARGLLAIDMPPSVREQLTAALAQHGDPHAQLETIAGLTGAVERGEKPEPPHWLEHAEHSDLLPTLDRLARAAITRQADKARSFALAGIEQYGDDHALALLVALAADHANELPWLEVQVERVARRYATQAVLARLLEALSAVVAWFENAV